MGVSIRVPRECQLYAGRKSIISERRKVAGAPGTGVFLGRGWGHFVWRPEETPNWDCVAALERTKSRLKISLVQPCGLERLIDVSPLAPDSLGDLSGAHSFLA
jgi:hypothetical protein